MMVPTSTTPTVTTQIPGVALPMSRLVLGTMTFGDTADEAMSAELLETALAAGINSIDTANAYAGGVTEKILAPLLKPHRDQIVLASKAGMPHEDHGGDAPLSATGLRRSVEGSLRRLQVDRLDLFYLHQPDRATPLAETLETVAALVAEQKIGALAVSNFAAWQIGDVVHTADQVGAPRPVIAQQVYNLVARRIEEEYREFAAAHEIHTMVYNPLGGGLLTGRHSFGAKPTEGRFGDSRLAAMYTQRYWDEQLFAAIGELSQVADQAGISLIELALRWTTYRAGVGSILLGGSKTSQLQSNLESIARGPLADDVVVACDAIGAGLRGPMPAYNR